MPTLRLLALLAVSSLVHAAEVKYQLVPDFLGTPPGRAQIGNSHGEIAVDSAGLIYVSVQDKDAGLQVYGKDGKYLKTLPLPMSLHGFVIRKSAEGEFIYAAVLGEQRFLKAKLDGTIVMEIKPDAFPADKGKAKDKAGKSVNALKLTNCDVAANGDIYVVDGYGKSWIFVFDKDGKFKSVFGGPTQIVDEKGFVISELRYPTPHASELIALLGNMFRELGGGAALGIGVPGLITSDGTINASPNMRGALDIPVGPSLRASLGVPVHVENDATSAAFAEWKVGAARDEIGRAHV